MNTKTYQILAFVIASIVFIAALAPTSASAGFYLSSDLGLNIQPAFDTDGSDNDPGTGNDPAFTGDDGSRFTYMPGGTDWSNDFDAATGLLTSAAIGFGFGDFYRIEAEYLYRHSAHHDRSDLNITNLASGLRMMEFERLEERIGGISAHGLSFNAYFDYPIEKWKPYLGFGVGFTRTEIDYHLLASRTAIASPESVRGRTTAVTTKLDDISATLQFLLGIDRQISDQMTLGIKVRYVLPLSDFEDDGSYDQLRSHGSRVGDQDVAYRFSSDGLSFWGISFNIKYDF